MIAFSLVSIALLLSTSTSAAQTISYSELKLQSAVITAIFYASSIVLLLVFALFNVASRNVFGLWYTLHFSIGLFFVACVDGTAARLLWPNNPELTNWIPLATLLTLNGNGLLLAVYASQGESPGPIKNFRSVFQIMGLLSFVCVALIPIAPIIVLAVIANILFLPMVASQIMSVMSWRPLGEYAGERQYLYAGRFSRVTSLLFALSVLIVGSIGWYQISKDTFSYAELSYTAVRFIYAVLSLSLVATYLAYIVGIRKDHEDALRRELQAARRAAQASEDRLQAEREFARMRELASKRRQKLSEASHDIRQPLVSLRLTLDKLNHSQDFKDDIEYQQALSYIDRLAESFSAPERDAESERENENESLAHGRADTEVMPMNLLFQTIQQMFGAEADSKSMQLRTVPTNMTCLVNPIAVMRIVSNVISNSIEHSGSHKALLGCRRDGTQIRIELHDGGKGVTKVQFEKLSERGVKGKQSEGQGLGLANCVELADSHGYLFGVYHSPLAGNYFALTVPRSE